MSQPAHDYELSVMEDLDPEPSGRATSVRAREVVLGVLLLVGVLGWAGWQWWHGESLRNSYERGRQAVIAQQWDEARSYFASANGYKDATARAGDAEKKIEERNKQYEIAAVHAEAGEWVVALKAAQAAAAIQPHYKDLDALITEAEKQVYREALNGTIARRLRDDPGLYYRGADGWVRLENSDRWSDVRNYREDVPFLYDVPGPGWVPQPTPTSASVEGQSFEPESGSPQLAGRQLIAASFQGESVLRLERLSLDPALYNFYFTGKAGVWAIHRSESSPRYPGLPIEGSIAGYEVDYEAYGSGLTSTVRIAPNMAVVDFGAQTGQLLLARFDPEAPETGGLELFIAGPDGSRPRLIYTTTGTIKTARFSPDGRYVLITTLEHIEGVNGKMTAVLLDLEGDAEPRMLVEVAVAVSLSGSRMTWDESSGLRAVFLHSGHFANNVLLTINNRKSGSEIKLIDPEHPDWSRTLAAAHNTGSVYTPVFMHAYEQPDGDSLVIYSAPRSGIDASATLSIARYDIALAQWTYVPVRVETYEQVILSPERRPDNAPGFTSFMVVEDRLFYAAYSYNRNEWTTIFYSVPLADLGKKAPALTEVFQRTRSPESRSASSSWTPGPNLFVYTDEQHALHVRTYDGAIDLVLERGVEFVLSNWSYGY
ncbi:MAG: hypothetical protein M3437_13930 [Chloroflexota bacterium]|nr:hypothetical protein [Chloroflexota bacterium]MDQ5864481.1 hypothetical protein [Chloroflexota bacterium]